MPHPTAKENVERIRTIVALARRHGAVSMHQLQNELEAHVSTIKRDIDVLRDRLGCPLEYDRTRRVYMIRNDLLAGGGPYELPGLWFNSSELYALLTMLQL
jgi:predicted DNA-binding transcriptional regulator YafY